MLPRGGETRSLIRERNKTDALAMAFELEPLEALALWRGAIVESVRRETPDLTARQMALLLTVYLTAPPHTVRGLAAALNISKPAVTRALDRLGKFGLVRRKREEADRRSVVVERTVTGSVFLSEFGDIVAESARAVG